MLNCLPTVIARYMYECLHNYFMVRLPYQFPYKGCRMMTSLLLQYPNIMHSWWPCMSKNLRIIL